MKPIDYGELFEDAIYFYYNNTHGAAKQAFIDKHTKQSETVDKKISGDKGDNTLIADCSFRPTEPIDQWQKMNELKLVQPINLEPYKKAKEVHLPPITRCPKCERKFITGTDYCYVCNPPVNATENHALTVELKVKDDFWDKIKIVEEEKYHEIKISFSERDMKYYLFTQWGRYYELIDNRLFDRFSKKEILYILPEFEECFKLGLIGKTIKP